MVKDLTKALTYVDQRVEFELKKTTNSLRAFSKSSTRDRLIEQWGQSKYEAITTEMAARVEELKAQRKKCLLFQDDKGLSTYSGLAHRLGQASKVPVEVRYSLPEFDIMPWEKIPRHKDRPYQVEAHDLLIAAAPYGPCGIELPTGAGKSTVIRNMTKTIALGTVIMAPSISIAGQLFDDLTSAFGKRYVGMYGDGKKQFDRQIVVGIDDSLAKVEPGSDAWKALSVKPVFFSDESHLTPANSLQKVCFGLMKNAPYRFFVSATQMRNDGLDLVLDGITGRIVLRKTARELIDCGWLSKPVFKMVRVRSRSSLSSPDANRMTRAHFYYNPIVNRVAADLANKFVTDMKRPTIILVEELEQFRELLPHLKHAVAFAHGPLTKATKELVPEAYRVEKPKALVERFNRGEVPILVGTSCIATGTDIQVAEAGIYLMGGKSEIKLKQGVGRETRGGFDGSVVNPWTGVQKVDCIHVDFDVIQNTGGGDDENDDFAPHRHAMARAEIYADIYDPAKIIDYTHILR